MVDVIVTSWSDIFTFFMEFFILLDNIYVPNFGVHGKIRNYMYKVDTLCSFCTCIDRRVQSLQNRVQSLQNSRQQSVKIVIKLKLNSSHLASTAKIKLQCCQRPV